MSKQPAPTASAIGPCPTNIQIVGRPGTRSLPRTIAPPDHPMCYLNFLASKYFVRPAASLLEKLSIFINFDMLNLLLPTLSLEPMDGFLPN